jgi:hypothetical protein
VLVAPAHAELYCEGNPYCGPDALKDGCNMGQVAQQATAAIATDHALGGAAEIEVNHVKAFIFDNPGRIRQGEGIGAEELGGDRVLILVVG